MTVEKSVACFAFVSADVSVPGLQVTARKLIVELAYTGIPSALAYYLLLVLGRWLLCTPGYSYAIDNSRFFRTLYGVC